MITHFTTLNIKTPISSEAGVGWLTDHSQKNDSWVGI